MQALGYCNALGFPYFAVTDGRHWELYETFQPVALPEKLVMKLDLNGPIARTCLDALALWRSGVVAGSAKTGVAPVTDEHPQAAVSTSTPSTAPKPSSTEHWHQLSEFTPMSGTMPLAVRLPDKTEAHTRGWGDFIAEIGRWLYEAGHLDASLMPIQRSPNSYVVAAKPENPNGKPFSAHRQIGPFYANVNLTSVALTRNARSMIERTGQNPADFAVRLQ